MFFEATKGGARIAFRATMIEEIPAHEGGFFKSAKDHKVRIHLTRDSKLAAFSELDGNESIELDTSYDNLLKYAEQESNRQLMGIVNIDRFNPKFSW